MIQTFPGLRRACGRLDHDIVASIDCLFVSVFCVDLSGLDDAPLYISKKNLNT